MSRAPWPARAGGIGLALASAALAVVVAGCSVPETSPPASSSADLHCGEGRLAGAGATFQEQLQTRWISDFTTSCYTATVTYDGVGSGGGIERFIAGEVDFTGSDALLRGDEQQAADQRCARTGGAPGQAVHIPLASGALVFLYNLPGVPELRLSPATVAAIFQQQVRRWDDPRIATDNPGTRLPDLPVRPVHRADSSGSTSILADFLSASASQQWLLGTGRTLTWPEGSPSASLSGGVTTELAQEEGSITYAGLSYAAALGLPTAALQNPAGNYVTANRTSIAAALAGASLDTHAPDPRLMIDFTPADPAAYPAPAVTYAIVCRNGNTNPGLLRSYLGYALTSGQDSTNDLGYTRLADASADRARQAAATLG